jgi:hypothetical protein
MRSLDEIGEEQDGGEGEKDIDPAELAGVIALYGIDGAVFVEDRAGVAVGLGVRGDQKALPIKRPRSFTVDEGTEFADVEERVGHGLCW